ncbi:unnamed protein product [Prorocentrum cordatum]|uniref:Uncharacterized protein n=1 Tax=Prorocentrum cordatum TaxID=2364126 RepID=A0ABN9PXP7_9DINO|nr:unnamed protein product [Polarella glacialis]
MLPRLACRLEASPRLGASAAARAAGVPELPTLVSLRRWTWRRRPPASSTTPGRTSCPWRARSRWLLGLPQAAPALHALSRPVSRLERGSAAREEAPRRRGQGSMLAMAALGRPGSPQDADGGAVPAPGFAAWEPPPSPWRRRRQPATTTRTR